MVATTSTCEDADCARVIDSLSASIGAERAAVTALNLTVQRLASRWFVIRDAHIANGIALFQPRWAMSLFRGPMTRTELKRAREQHAGVIGRVVAITPKPDTSDRGHAETAPSAAFGGERSAV